MSHISRIIIPALIILCAAGLTSCDRGAGEEVGIAKKFSDAVVRNDAIARDSMIATRKFKEYFTNPYVSRDMLTWFHSFYDYKTHLFTGAVSADVDRNLTHQLEGGLLDTAHIDGTGMVEVKSPQAGEEAAYFWLVHQEGKPWKVAMVTKGEMELNFNQ